MSAHVTAKGAASVAFMLLVAGLMPLLAGCGQLRSIDERAMVTGVAIDRGEEPGTVQVMLQWYHGGEPAQASTGGGGGGGASVLLANRSAKGTGIADAVAAIQARTDRQFNFGVTEIILVSEDLAREGVAPYLDYLWRKPEFSQLAQIIVVRGKASEMLEAGGPSGTAFRLYQYMSTARAAAAGSVPIPFWRFLALSYAKVQDPWAPLLTLDKGHFASVGTAVFQGDRMTGALGRSQTAGLSWILHVAGYQDITTAAPGSGAPLSLHVQSTSVQQSVDQQGIAHLRLVLSTQVQEGYRVNLSMEDLRGLESVAAQTALSDVQSTIRDLQAAGSDVVGFGERLRERSPRATENWIASFARLPVAVEVTVHIRAGGRAA
ncbi:MAG: Ger(x)C family spore germination protein [Thermaerobacter sp.]|nr:Ger(x)C family spore germination protein [Thermaerobacter sp.]